MSFKEYRLNKTTQPISEELTYDEKYKAERMQEMGRDSYLRHFHEQHPNFAAALKSNPGDKQHSVRIPIDLTESSERPHAGVTDFLSEKGFHTTPESYKDGLAHKSTMVGNPAAGIPMREKTVTHKIGRVLDEHGASDDIKKAFVNDSFRTGAKTKQYDAIVTAHVHDIVGGSTDRGWISCANIRRNDERDAHKGQGPAAKKLPEEVNNMTHHVYLVPRGGNVDTDAIGRTSYKLHTGVITGHKTLIPENQVYGTPPTQFLPKANELMGHLFQKSNDEIYRKHKGVYNDNGKDFHFPEHSTPEGLDAAWKSLSKEKDDYTKGKVVAMVNPDHKYKAKTLNDAAKSISGIRKAGESGDFGEVLKSVWDAHNTIPEKAHHYLAYDNDRTSDIIEHAVSSTFNPHNPDHINALSRAGTYRPTLMNKAINTALKAVGPVKNHEEFLTHLKLRERGINTGGYNIPLADDHTMGKNPLDHLVSKLSEHGHLDHNTFREAYLSTNSGNRKKGNLYDHAVRLEGEGIPGMSDVVNAHAAKLKTQSGTYRAYSYYMMQPKNRARISNQIGEDHTKVMKDYPTRINDHKAAQETMKKAAAIIEGNNNGL